MREGRRFRRGAGDPGQDSPLGAAVSLRDRDTLAMVARAVARREVLLAFQPVVEAARQDRCAYHEALIRLLDETGRIIPARDFIAAIETTELGRAVDCLSLELGLGALREDPGLRLAVNMSARSIAYPRWMQTLRRGIRGQQAVAERLILEITEGSAMIMPDAVAVFMAEMQSEGIAFALDDFGAGHTALSHLREFYFDILKIDGQYIRGIAGNPDNQCLTQAFLAIARQFDMITVAESVECAADAAWLAAAGADCMQGYYFGAPTATPPRQMAERLRA